MLKLNDTVPSSDRKLRSADPEKEKENGQKENGDKDADIVEIDDGECGNIFCKVKFVMRKRGQESSEII